MDFHFRLKQLPSKTKKGPCIQSMSDGHRGLKDDLYDQRNAVIFSENAKKPSLNMHSDWALECDISRWGVRIKKQFQITGWYLFCREGLKKYFNFWISNFSRWKRLIFAKKYDKSTDFSVLLFVTSFLSCIDVYTGQKRYFLVNETLLASIFKMALMFLNVLWIIGRLSSLRSK